MLAGWIFVLLSCLTCDWLMLPLFPLFDMTIFHTLMLSITRCTHEMRPNFFWIILLAIARAAARKWLHMSVRWYSTLYSELLDEPLLWEPEGRSILGAAFSKRMTNSFENLILYDLMVVLKMIDLRLNCYDDSQNDQNLNYDVHDEFYDVVHC